MTDDEVAESIQAALVDELGVHPSDVEVEYDSATGVATYIITSDDAESLADIISTTEAENFSDSLPVPESIQIDSSEPLGDITVTVDVIVDASNVDDADVAVDAVSQSLRQQNPSYDINGEGNKLIFLGSNHIKFRTIFL